MTRTGRRRRGLTLALVLVSSALAVGRARADGAFPDSFAPLLPRTRPREILLTTNFGLIASEDDGATWTYACEVPASAGGRLYNLGAPPAERIHAVSTPGLVTSDDAGCGWIVGGGALAGATVLDGFPDPHDAARVLAIAAAAGTHDAAIFESRDGGVTFAGPLFAPPAGAVLTGVEVSVSAAATIFVSFYETPGIHPRLARSTDGGARWSSTDLEPALGPGVPFLAAVDAVDADTVYLRLSGRSSNENAFEALAITHDAGATWTTPLILPGGTLTTFVRRTSGELLATGTLAAVATAHRSRDGGATFVPWPLSIHPRGFAERDGTLYAATDNVADGFALATSADGDRWTPVMRYQDVTAVRACLQSTCDADCRYRAGLGLFAPAICASPAVPPPIPTTPVLSAGPHAAGCTCAAGGAPPPAGRDLGAALVAVGILALALRHRPKPL